MTLKIDKRYLALPVSEHAQVKKLCFKSSSGELLYDLDVKLDPVGSQFVYYADLGRFLGQTLTVDVEPSVGFAPVLTEDMPKEGEQKFRPAAHFTPERGWINDPNGLVLYEGTYHLFYQHNPVGMNWGNMHWGHAVSTDLFHWKEQEMTLFPDEFGTMYSGSAVVDKRNVSHLKRGGHDPILLFYTAAGGGSSLSAGKKHVQCMAYSTDGGYTFKKYSDNPVVDHIVGGNRDPKVIFCQEIDAYIMALYLDGETYALFRSEDLLKWELLQKIDIPGDAECPDFFPLWLDGEKYWILSGASDYYYVGKIVDGQFGPVQKVRQLKGSLNTGYAAQTYSGLADNRRVRLYWNTFSLPGMAFNGSMSTPVELFLLRDVEGIALGCRPTPEINVLHGKTESGFGKVRLPGRANDVLLTVPEECGEADIHLVGLTVTVDAGQSIVRVGKDQMKAPAKNGAVRLRIVQDVHSVEIFTEDGTGYFCVGHLADQSMNAIVALPCVHIEAVELTDYRK